jgi:hypothetical protein
MKPTIDLVYFDGCPHVDAARDALRAALGERASAAAWREWRSDDPALPVYAAGYGSPSIFVAGREVTGAQPAQSATACRVYADAAGRRLAAPSPRDLAAAIEAASR